MDRAEKKEELWGTVVHHQGVEGDQAAERVHLDLVPQHVRHPRVAVPKLATKLKYKHVSPVIAMLL